MRTTPFFVIATLASFASVGLGQPAAKDYRDAVLREHLGQFWGALLVIDAGEVVLSGGFGVQDAQGLRPIDERSLFDIGSISKPITAIAILQLVERDKISLDTTMGDLFGDVLAQADPALPTRAITVRHLLTHTSGLSDRVAIQRLDFPDRDEAVRLALTSEPESEPGQRWAYCNAGYIVLAAAVEKASGEGFEAYVRERIFQPAGLDGTGFISGDGLNPEHFTTRELYGRGPTVRRGLLEDGWGWGLRGASGVLTGTNDLARFHNAITTPGVLLSADSLELMDTLAWNEGQPMALGWFADPSPDGTPRRRHGGSTRGYMAELRRYPERDSMIAVLTNMRWRPDATADALEAILLGIEASWARAEFDLSGLALNQFRLATIEALALRVDPDGAGGTTIFARTEGHDALRLVINASTARVAHGSLRTILESGADNTITSTELQLGTWPYTLDGTKLTIVGEGVSLRILPDYNGQSGPTLVLQDEANSFWPVVMRLSNADAKLLAEGLAQSPKGNTK